MTEASDGEAGTPPSSEPGPERPGATSAGSGNNDAPEAERTPPRRIEGVQDTTPPAAPDPEQDLLPHAELAEPADDGEEGEDGEHLSRAERLRQRRHRSTRQAIEWVVLIGVALVVAFVIKTFLFQAFYIPSASMDPTLKIHDRVLVNKLSYKLHSVHRGDIVVFTKPKDEPADIKDLIKRVIALPGERVEGHDGHVYINGRLLREPYLPRGVTTDDFAAVTVPPHDVWVMGDNRPGSQDSRSFGPIRESSIVGRAFVKIWPFSRLGFL